MPSSAPASCCSSSVSSNAPDTGGSPRSRDFAKDKQPRAKPLKRLGGVLQGQFASSRLATERCDFAAIINLVASPISIGVWLIANVHPAVAIPGQASVVIGVIGIAPTCSSDP